jgi:hypothetical protein
MPNKFFIIFVFLFFYCKVHAQILHADGFGRPVDSTHHFKGALDAGMSINKQSSVIVSFDAKGDVSYWHLNNVLISTNAYSLFRTGSKNLINGGFSHLRFRMHIHRKIQPEFYGQYQLDNIRGMKERLLAGSNLRYKIVENQKAAVFAALGAMYEFEKWDYSGIRPDATPKPDTVRNHFIKLNSYISYRQKFNEQVNMNFIFYFQSRPDRYFIVPRVSAEAHFNFKVSKHISFAFHANLYYDAAPPVPIYNLYYTFVNRLVFTF